VKDLIKKILKEEQDLEWAKDLVNSEFKPTPSVIVDTQTTNPKDALELHVYIEYGDADFTERNIIMFYRNGKGYNDYNGGGLNFDDFERVLSFLNDRSVTDSHQQGWNAQFDNEEFREMCYDEGLIGYSEMHDYTKKARRNGVYYYDSMGNKYHTRIV
jgi:hypothetical protein